MNSLYTQEICETILSELQQYLLGNEELLRLFLVAYLARGHLLIEGPPGTGKTLTARLMAQKLALTFKRVQFTSDLLPGDITGSHIYLPAEERFHFIPGPLFADFVLADEVNRSPPRTQSALLEAMEERQITLDGNTFRLKDDFFVVATQNPFEFEGTFPLPEAQIDRFLFKAFIKHSSAEHEVRMIEGVLSGKISAQPSDLSETRIDRGRIDAEIAAVRIDQSLLKCIASLLDATRQHPAIMMGASVRGGLAIAKGARVLALLNGRDFVIPDDIKFLAVPALRHRIRLSPEAQVNAQSEAALVEEIVKETSFPV